MFQQVLASRNAHPRDAFIKFYSRGHKYEITTDPKSKYTSVTTWNHGHFPKFDADSIIQKMFASKSWGPEHKYWGMTADEIKNSWKSNGDAVAGAGTNLHERIELFMNNSLAPIGYTHADLLTNLSLDTPDEHVEWNYFLQFVKDFPDLKPFRTEWMIYDEDLKLAGSIDMVYENPDGTLAIYDWKRSKEIAMENNWNQVASNPLIQHLPHTNYWHYSLQLNTYKTILERKYGKTITRLCLVRLHPSNEAKTYDLIEVPILEKEMADLFEERAKNVSA